MRLVQRGIANNFGLVGKNIRKYLATTALTATGLMAVATPALADNWTDHVATEGSITVDTGTPNTTNITQNTDFTKVSGDGDINAGWTVNVAQPSNNSKYVLYDIENDPTKIMGNLNANGKIYIFDKNGVVFGEGSQVNVGSIVTSTGHISDANIKAGKHVFEDVGGAGEIVNDGSITVSEGGLAAFVAPAVRNNGVINAKAGTVALASGNKVTLDLYGDGLVSVAADGELANAIIENKGTINASGGNVALTVAAAKNAVDSVVNMDGIINVSSKTGKGGKVSINGGKKGVVKVAGTIEANGEGGGDISVTGQNIHLTETSILSVDAGQHGNGGTVGIVADNAAIFRGRIYARGGAQSGNGGFIDTSAFGYLGLGGTVDTSAYNGLFGTWLIDPLDFEIRLGSGDTIGDGDVVDLNTTWLPSGTNGYGDAISYIYESEIEGQNTSFILRAQRNITVSGTSADGTVQLQPGRSLTLETQNGAGNAGSINLTGSTHGNSLLFRTTGAGSININGSTSGTSSSDVILSRLQTDGGGVNVTTGNGQIFVNGAIVTANGAVNMTASNRIFVDNDITTNGGAANFTATTFTTDDTNPAGSPDNLDQIKTGGGNVKIVADNVNLGETLPIQAQTIIDAGSGNVTITRKTAGSMAVGNSSAYGQTHISNGELNSIKAGSLNIGALLEADNKVTSIFVDNVDTTANISGLVTFNTWLNQTDGVLIRVINSDSVDNNNVMFWNTNKFNKLTVNSNDHIDIFSGSSVTSNGDVVFNADVNNQGVGALLMGSGAVVDTNGKNFTYKGHQVLLLSGTKINAEGGNILFNNDDVFYSQSADSLNTQNNGTITLNQWDKSFSGTIDPDFGGFVLSVDGSVQNAVNAVQNTGNGLNTVIVGEGTYNESVNVAENNFLIRSRLNYNVNPNTGVRLAESIIDPASPGFHITGDNVEINGMLITSATGADGYGVWVDVGADNAKIKNNIINNVSQNAVFSDTALATIVENNEIDNTGSHGVYIKNGSNARVNSNYIGTNGPAFNINGDGIQIRESDGTWAKYNHITNTTRVVDRIGSGIQSIDSDNVELVENVIWNTEWDGIRLDKGTKILVKKNDIDDVVRTGIYMGAVSESTAIDNDIDLAGRYGIHADGGDKVTIDNNWIDTTGLHGIYSRKTKNLVAQNNDIGLSGGLNNIKQHGIFVEEGKNALIKKNIIQQAVWDGINVFKTEGARINENQIRYVDGNGIEVLDSFELTGVPGSLEIYKNKVNDTGSHGIYIVTSTNAQVLSNEVGLLGAAFNINGDGIRLEKAHGSDVKKNDIRYTKSTAHNIGSGVHSLEGNDIYIYDNHTRDTDWDGVRVEKGDGIVIDKNDIDRAVRTGIYTTATKNTTISNNDIDVVGHWGIRVNAGDTVMIDNNWVDKTALYDGIYAQKVKKLTIQNNDIGESGGSNNINRHGINVENSDSAIVYKNDVTQAKGHGIYVNSGSDYTDISYNKIWKVDQDGINVDGGVGVDIWENKIDDVGEDGIDVENNDYADIWKNYIDGTGENGIEVSGSDYIEIKKNEITDAGQDGINVYGGIFADIIGNTVYGKEGFLGIGASGAKRDGIHVVNNFGVDIKYNKILGGDGALLGIGGNGADRNGIFVWNSDYADISGNKILAGSPGLLALGGAGAGDDGIDVWYTKGADITFNKIVGVLDDGIQLVHSKFADVYFNLVSLTGDDGVFLWKSDGANIGFNAIGLTGDDGVDIRHSDYVDVFANLIGLTKGDGIQARHSNKLDIKYNYITLAGDDGIDIEDGYKVNIYKNHVGFSDHNGIEVSDSGKVYVGYNYVHDNRVGFYAQGDGNGYIEVSGNTFRDNRIGAKFQSGIIDLTGPGNYFYNGRIGMYFEVDSKDPTKLSLVRAGGGHTYDGSPYDTFPTVPFNPLTFGGTIGAQYFEGQSEYFVKVGDNTFVDPISGEAIWLDGSNSTYYFPLEGAAFTPSIDGVNPDRQTFLEDMFYHRVDQDGRGIFFFFPTDVPEVDSPLIEQSLIFNRFNTFNGDATGMNVQIVSLPSLGGGSPVNPSNFNAIGPFAGNNATDPSSLNQIETAAGGTGQPTANQLNQITPAAGGESQSCWGNAVAAAGNGQVVNVVYTGGAAANLSTAAACGTGF